MSDLKKDYIKPLAEITMYGENDILTVSENMYLPEDEFAFDENPNVVVEEDELI